MLRKGPSNYATEPEVEVEPVAAKERFIPPPTVSGRVRRFPQRFADFIPSLSTQLPHLPPRPQRAPSPEIPEREPTPDAPLPVDWQPEYETNPDNFGIYRAYAFQPSYDPESLQTLASLCDGPGLKGDDSESPPRSWGPRIESNHGPFSSETVFKLMRWVNNDNNTKSVAQIDELVNDIILAEGFNIEDLRSGPNGKFSTRRENERLDRYTQQGGEDNDDGPEFSVEDGWKEGTVVLRMPHARDSYGSEDTAPPLEIKGIWHRSMVKVLKSAFAEVSAEHFHLQPFKLYWRDPDDPNAPPLRLISELYNADAFLEEHSKLAAETGDDLERVIVAIMLWSDSTHLASFGNASLWPIYMYLGNLSKYRRGKPTSYAAHHIAYIPKVCI